MEDATAISTVVSIMGDKVHGGSQMGSIHLVDENGRADSRLERLQGYLNAAAASTSEEPVPLGTSTPFAPTEQRPSRIKMVAERIMGKSTSSIVAPSTSIGVLADGLLAAVKPPPPDIRHLLTKALACASVLPIVSLTVLCAACATILLCIPASQTTELIAVAIFTLLFASMWTALFVIARRLVIKISAMVADPLSIIQRTLQQFGNGSFQSNLPEMPLLEVQTTADTVSHIGGMLDKTIKELISMQESMKLFVPQPFFDLLGITEITSMHLNLCRTWPKMTVMFVDICDFVSLIEPLELSKLFEFLNKYLSYVVPVIEKNRGFVDKYIGDAIMALFPMNPCDAVNAAQGIFRAVERYNADRQERELPQVRVGVGLAMGQVMLGTMGVSNRMEVSVIGDIVNVASRLEALTRNFNVQCLASEEVAKCWIHKSEQQQAERLECEDNSKIEARQDLFVRCVGEITVKGKAAAVAVWEIVPERAELYETKKRNAQGIVEAVQHFRRGAFDSCLKMLSEMEDTDPVVRLYKTQCEKQKERKHPTLLRHYSILSAQVELARLRALLTSLVKSHARAKERELECERLLSTAVASHLAQQQPRSPPPPSTPSHPSVPEASLGHDPAAALLEEAQAEAARARAAAAEASRMLEEARLEAARAQEAAAEREGQLETLRDRLDEHERLLCAAEAAAEECRQKERCVREMARLHGLRTAELEQAHRELVATLSLHSSAVEYWEGEKQRAARAEEEHRAVLASSASKLAEAEVAIARMKTELVQKDVELEQERKACTRLREDLAAQREDTQRALALSSAVLSDKLLHYTPGT
eukprot:m51a1_g6646 putative adenylate guanylate cyclase (820) ;mRNA; r:118114-121994